MPGMHWRRCAPFWRAWGRIRRRRFALRGCLWPRPARCFWHLPLPKGLPAAGEYLPLLPPGLRAFALYVQAHYAYLQGDYSKSLGMAEATLAMQGEGIPSRPSTCIWRR